MDLINKAKDKLAGAYYGIRAGISYINKTAIMADSFHVHNSDRWVKEQLTELELMVDDMSWREITSGGSAWDFNRDSIRKMVTLSRLLYLANPLIKRAVTVQELYVWGSGCTIQAEDEMVQEVLMDFFEDPKNQCVLGDSWAEREREQRVDGNTFFIFFVNPATGSVRIRLIPVDEIQDIIFNPEDRKEPWYYIRSTYTSEDPILGKSSMTGSRVAYPDILYNPRTHPDKLADGSVIDWSVRVLHLKTGGMSGMKFGVPELFSTLNWARAYKKILENFATILDAYARVAMQVTQQKGKKDVAASKSRLGTSISSGSTSETNPPTNTASWFLSSGGVQISAVKTAHATTGPDEARALRSMVAAGSDTPEHFFGDSDIGNFATSTTLDRPTELKMVSRQKMWTDVIQRMCQIVIEQSTLAPRGKLRKSGFTLSRELDRFDNTQIYKVIPPNGNSLKITIKFPNIVERDVVQRVRAVVQAATLNGSKAEGIIPDRKFLFEMLLEALGTKNVKELSDKYYPDSVFQGFVDPEIEMKMDRNQAEEPEVTA
jgi:hypothetical protein